MMRRSLTSLGALAALLMTTLTAGTGQAQRRRGTPEFEPNVAYDGRLTWVRVKYIMPDFSSSSGFLLQLFDFLL